MRVQQGAFPVPAEDRLQNSTQEQLLDELVRHQLVLRENGFLLFPSQLTREHPERSALEGQSIMAFTFAGPVLSIYTTLVVRLTQSGVFQKRDFWQDVVTYTTRLGGMYGLLLSPRGEEQAKLGLFLTKLHVKKCVFTLRTSSSDTWSTMQAGKCNEGNILSALAAVRLLLRRR